jgi:hypothetical protein
MTTECRGAQEIPASAGNTAIEWIRAVAVHDEASYGNDFLANKVEPDYLRHVTVVKMAPFFVDTVSCVRYAFRKMIR